MIATVSRSGQLVAGLALLFLLIEAILLRTAFTARTSKVRTMAIVGFVVILVGTAGLVAVVAWWVSQWDLTF